MCPGRSLPLMVVAAACWLAAGCSNHASLSSTASSGTVSGSTGTTGGSSGGGTTSNQMQVTVSGVGSLRVSTSTSFAAQINGAESTAVTWSVNGITGGNGTVGTISSSGAYTAPSLVPTPSTVTVTATSTASTGSSGSTTTGILNPIPILNSGQSSDLLAGVDATVTLSGSGFVSGATVLVGGVAVPTTVKNSTQVVATVSGTLLPSGAVSFAVKNPDPGSATSNSISISTTSMPSDLAQVTLSPGAEVPQDFLGMSYEWGDASWYMGWPSVKVNTIYRQLLKNLMNGHDASMQIRIGGGTTDASTWPTSDTATAFSAYSSLANDMKVHFVFGVNLASNDVAMATAQAKAYLSYMPTGTVDAIEIGNEPDDYVYNGKRSTSYSITDYLAQYAQWRQSIQPLLPSSTHFMGPGWGELKTLTQRLSAFEAQESSYTSIISQHTYAAKQDNGETYPVDYLLTSAASAGGPSSVASSVVVAHGKGQKFRMGEFNSIDAGGVVGISNTFSSSLWAVDTMFEYAKVGVDGVNWHGMSGCTYCALTLKVTNNGPYGNIFSLTQVNPLYYGMLLFQQSTANHSRLLPVRVQTKANIKVWSTIDASGTVYVVILNKDESFGGNFAVVLSGYGDAKEVRMLAPSYQSTAGITIGGQTFDGSKDGNLTGTATSRTIPAQNGTYQVTLTPASATLLVLTK